MKKILPFFSLFLLVLSLMPLTQAKAQSEAPYIVDTTMPVDAGVKASVEAWLGASAPVPLTYWAITYAEPRGPETLISLVALMIDAPGDPWSVADDNTVAWMGTVIVHLDTSVEMYSSTPTLKTPETFNFKALAAPALSTGGGSHLSFPWKQGSTMMYGPSGVHAAGGGGWYAVGFEAVDFVGGDDMGSGVAKNSIYAVDPGVVDYVCSDDNAVTIRTHNESTDEYYIYAHLLDNNNLVMDHAFADRALIGKVKYGPFENDGCGWAEQEENHYHLHFGFQRDGGTFRMGSCILNGEKWKCGTKTISTGQFFGDVGGGSDTGTGTGTGGSNTGDDGGYAIDQPSFWDYVVVGVVSMWQKMVLNNMPEHTPLKYTEILLSAVKLTLKIAWVMIYSNVDLGPLVACVALGITIKFILGVAELIVFGLKAWKSLVPVLGA